ncbi:leucine aminopeptidase [Mycena olivaceomarginata]|nr:leucine aminopeptidase [Mycena olivaceomarginata]
MTTSASIHPFDPKSPTQTVGELWTPAKEPKVGTTRVFFSDKITALSSLGPDLAKKGVEAKRELVRKSVGSAVQEIKRVADEVTEVVVDASIDPHAAAVAAHLALYSFTLKTDPPSAFNPNLKEPIPPKIALKPLSASQNGTRVWYTPKRKILLLMELPGNMMTPTIFCQRAQAEFAGIENLIPLHSAWAAEKGMRTFLSVTRGSAEPANHYKGGAPDAKPLVLVGKGITFDTGGISLKPGADMKLMRGDMGGAAAVVAAALAIAQLKLPINVVVLAPLAENMPSSTATKPGDIIYAMNGKSVEVDNTDAEGRLTRFTTGRPNSMHTLIDVATLTGAMDIALGEVFTGVFTTSRYTLERLHAAGETEYDRFWRMPIDEDYGPQIYSAQRRTSKTPVGKPAGSCTAALFLKAFVHGLEPTDDSAPLAWAHVDIAGDYGGDAPDPYLGRGMTGQLYDNYSGLIEYARRLAAQ